MASSKGLELIASAWIDGREAVEFEYVKGTSSLTGEPIDSVHIVQKGDFIVLDRAQFIELFNFMLHNCDLTFGEVDLEW